MDERTRDREEAEAKAKRIERWRQTGRIFESTPDLRWLFIELALANGGELDWLDQDRLTNLVAEPIWGSLWSKGGYFDDLVEQGAIFIENSKFHCTALRDFFISRMIACLIQGETQQKRSNIWYIASTIAVIVACLFFGGWGLLVLAFVIWSELQRSKLNEQLRQIVQDIDKIYFEVRRGGYDEPAIIRRVEGIEQRHVHIPSVLYALLRQPRRNVEKEISREYNALSDDKKNAMWAQWQAFIDFMLKNDDGEAARKQREIEENECAEVFAPISVALDELSLQFVEDKTVRFLSKDKSTYRAGYEIDIKHDGLRHYLYVRCATSGEGKYHYPMRVCVPESDCKWLWFFRGEESKATSVISALLSRYREKRALGAADVDFVLANVQALAQSVGQHEIGHVVERESAL